jgi:hypothetical protein
MAREKKEHVMGGGKDRKDPYRPDGNQRDLMRVHFVIKKAE